MPHDGECLVEEELVVAPVLQACQKVGPNEESHNELGGCIGVAPDDLLDK